MQIREMERQLGVTLVERRPGEVALTDVGAEVAQRGQGMLTAARDLEDFARHHGRLLTGKLTLGVIPTLAPYLLPRILPQLQRAYPDLRVELRETQTKILVEELGRGALDVLLLALPVTDAEVETARLFQDPFLLAVPAGDPRSANARVTAADIDQHQLILLEEGHCLRDQALAFCASALTGGAVGLGATSLTTVMQMVANGYGVTLVPQVAAEVEARDERVKLLRFAPPQPGRSIGLAWRRTSPRKDDFAALGKLVKNVLNKTAGGKASDASR
jgi:LysR family hydrogen peroxide-inducible transcriptional activator